MFTGITEETGEVISAKSNMLSIGANKVIQEMAPGDSMAVNGVCLTITALNADSFSVDVMSETIKRSNLGLLKAGDAVNLERPLVLGGRIGGHLVQGHVDATGEIVSVVREKEEVIISIEAPDEVMCYIVEKGFIAVDGISLTVINCSKSTFSVSIVDYTWQNTTMSSREKGDLVNLEVDIIAKYVEQLVNSRKNGITLDYLKEHGFLIN